MPFSTLTNKEKKKIAFYINAIKDFKPYIVIPINGIQINRKRKCKIDEWGLEYSIVTLVK